MNSSVLFAVLLCMISVKAQETVLSPEKLLLLVPDHLNGFRQEEVAKAKMMEIGNLKYSLCEQRFNKGDQKVKILMFDFGQAKIMYNQATKEWNNYTPVISDTVTLRAVLMTNCTGWESYHVSSNTSQIYLGICDRFFLHITGDQVNLASLKLVLDQFKFEEFPK